MGNGGGNGGASPAGDPSDPGNLGGMGATTGFGQGGASPAGDPSDPGNLGGSGQPTGFGHGQSGLGGYGQGNNRGGNEDANDFTSLGLPLPVFAEGQHGTPVAALSGQEGEDAVHGVLTSLAEVPFIGLAIDAIHGVADSSGQPSGNTGDIGGPDGGFSGPGADPKKNNFGYDAPNAPRLTPGDDDTIVPNDDEEITPGGIRDEARRRRGRWSTILTGPQGLLYRPNVKRSTLLGF